MSDSLGVGVGELAAALGSAAPDCSGPPDSAGAGEDGAAEADGSAVAGAAALVLGVGSASSGVSAVFSSSLMPSRSPTPSTNPFQPSTIGLPVSSPAAGDALAEAEADGVAPASGAFFTGAPLSLGLGLDCRAASFFAAAAGRDGRPAG